MDPIVKRFNFESDEAAWNELVHNSKNSTFLFNRSFMDYHKHKFNDHSVLVFNEKNNIIAAFPAHEEDSVNICSHKGLSYGGFILKEDLKLPVIKDVYRSVLKYYYCLGFSTINYKAFPRIYNKIPGDEIDYCLFLSEAKLWRRDTAFVIDQHNPIKYSGNIRREANKAKQAGFTVQEESNFDSFWADILSVNLKKRFNVDPVHTIKEINKLKIHFPNHIKLYTVRKNNQDLAGAIIFKTKNVAHCQYISSTEFGRRSGALNLLFTELIDAVFKNVRYFDFGIANENNGKTLNLGLMSWKERMGGRTVSHDFYVIPTKSYINLLDEREEE